MKEGFDLCSRNETLEGYVSFKKDADSSLMAAYESLNSFKPEILKMVAGFADDRDIMGVKNLLLELADQMKLVSDSGSNDSKSADSGSDNSESSSDDGSGNDDHGEDVSSPPLDIMS